jgi:hypothetical protein
VILVRRIGHPRAPHENHRARSRAAIIGRAPA